MITAEIRPASSVPLDVASLGRTPGFRRTLLCASTHWTGRAARGSLSWSLSNWSPVNR